MLRKHRWVLLCLFVLTSLWSRCMLFSYGIAHQELQVGRHLAKAAKRVSLCGKPPRERTHCTAPSQPFTRCTQSCTARASQRPDEESTLGNRASKQMALFVHGDQITAAEMQYVLAALQPLEGEHGKVIAIKAFMSEERLELQNAWKDQRLVKQFGIQVQPAPNAIDATEKSLIQAALEWKNVTTIAIAAPKKLGYLKAMQTIKGGGQIVVAVCQCKTLLLSQTLDAQAYTSITDSVVYWQREDGASRKQQAAKVEYCVQMDGEDGFTEVIRRDKMLHMLSYKGSSMREMTSMFEHVVRKLSQLGYFTAESFQGDFASSLQLARGMILFHYANGLPGLRLFPPEDGLLQTYEVLINDPQQKWKEKPESLICVFPRGKSVTKKLRTAYGKNGMTQILAAGGPFIATKGPELVRTFLKHLGYLHASEEVSDCSLELLSRRNALTLHDAGSNGVSSPGCLEELLCSDRLPQVWRAAGKDINIRDMLKAKGHLSRKQASVNEVKIAVEEYLGSEGQDDMVASLRGKCYAWYIETVDMYLTRENPSHRPNRRVAQPHVPDGAL